MGMVAERMTSLNCDPEVLNPLGKGPFVLVCEHASNHVPEGWDDLGLSADQLVSHHAWDSGAADLTRALSKALDAPAVLSRVSRLFLDYNRPAYHPSQFPREIDGAPVPGNARLTEAEIECRERLAFFPMRDAVDHVIAARQALTRGPAVIAVHSCEPEMDGVARPWPVGIISQWDQRFAKRIVRFLEGVGVHPVGDNDPYDGRTAAGFTLTHHAGSRRLHNAAIEMRKDVLTGADGVAHWASLLADCLSAVHQEMAP